MISPARQTCFSLLSRIESRQLLSDDALNSENMERLEIRDRHLTTEIVYGSLRWQALLDHILAKASSLPWRDVEPEVKILLRMSLYQMWQMDRIPDHALVNDAVELAKHRMKRGVDRYINGILRRLARTRPWKENESIQEAPLWIQISLPGWLWKRWVARYGEIVAKEYARSLNTPPQIALRLVQNESVDGFPFHVAPSDVVPGAYLRVPGTQKRREEASIAFQIQDEASQLIPHLFGNIQEWKIWDACAAPGGKCAILRHKCGVAGRVTASDLRWERIARLVQSLRSGIDNNADVLVADARESPPFRGYFDAVLADVPCSGLGTLRRNPEIKWNFRPAELALLHRIQRKILGSVSETVRIGGCLLYSTCSTEPEENEQVIRSFLNAHPGFCLERPVSPPGIEKWIGPDQMVRTFPSTRLWDGFFAALMVRHS